MFYQVVPSALSAPFDRETNWLQMNGPQCVHWPDLEMSCVSGLPARCHHGLRRLRNVAFMGVIIF